MKLLIILLLTSIVSCASNQSRRPVFRSEVVLKGGDYQDKNWKEKIVFKRISWFQDATLMQEILVADLKKGSPFEAWLGGQKLEYDRCNQFFVSLLYADINASPKENHLSAELKGNKLSEQAILDFSRQLKAHPAFVDYKLQSHKIVGWCHQGTSNLGELMVTLPGYKTQKLKL